MKKFIALGAAAVLFLGLSVSLSAQKLGYVDTESILAEMPEVKQADANLEALQKQLQKKGQGMVQALQTDYQAVQQKAQAGELSPLQQQQESERLEKKQQEIVAFEQEMSTTLQSKRAELLQPILERVDQAIKDVAAENEFTMIFDKQMILFGSETQDITSMVKSKLGL